MDSFFWLTQGFYTCFTFVCHPRKASSKQSNKRNERHTTPSVPVTAILRSPAGAFPWSNFYLYTFLSTSEDPLAFPPGVSGETVRFIWQTGSFLCIGALVLYVYVFLKVLVCDHTLYIIISAPGDNAKTSLSKKKRKDFFMLSDAVLF